jgi:hypothetical protein
VTQPRRDYRKQPLTEEEEHEGYLWSLAQVLAVQPNRVFLAELEGFIDRMRRKHGTWG